MNKRSASVAIGLLLVGSLIGQPLSALADSPLTTAAAAEADAQVTWRDVDWQAVAQARSDGDVDGAAEAREVGDALGDAPHTRNIWTSLAKRAVVQVLKHSISILPKKIRPYANRIVNVVEEIDSFQQTAVVAALTRAGIPYDVSVATAQWIVFFLGL